MLVRRPKRFPHKASLLPLFLVACTANSRDLAPASPSVAWPIERPPFVQASLEDGATESAGDVARRPDAADTVVAVDPQRSYGLVELIDLAQRSNPETRDAWERARQAAFGVGLAESAYLPQISAEAISGYQHATFPIPANVVPGALFTSSTRELVPTLAIRWLLFDFGRRAGIAAAARTDSFVANVAFTGAHQKLIFAVSRDYFALTAARGRLHVAEDALRNAQVVNDAVNTRRSHGLATTVEVAQAARQLAEARFDLAKASGDEHSAYHALLASMGVSPTIRINVMDNNSAPLPSSSAQTVERRITEALADRPDIIAALGRVHSAGAKLAEARADYNPTIALEAQGFENIGQLSAQGSRYYSVNKPGGNVLLKFSWPLFDGGARDARVGIARSGVEAARDQLDQTRNTAVKQVTDAYDAMETGLAEHDAATSLQDAARFAYDSALDAYGHGVGTYTDLVSSETALTRSQSAVEDARATVFTAAAGLAFATGSIANARVP
jgi:outer membrane protein TolC